MKNYKIASILTLLILTVAMLTACGSDPIRDDLKSYVNDKFPAVHALENKAAAAYNAVSGPNYTDDATMLAALKDTVVPASEEALAAAQKLAPATKEVAALNEQYIAALTSYNSSYVALSEALANGDAAKAAESTDLLTTAESQSADYTKALEALAKDHGLTITIK